MVNSPIDKFFTKIKFTPGGCWEWTGNKLPKGYGLFSLTINKTRYAHRIMFYWFNRTLSKDLHVCHTCDNPSCVNPLHLFEGTASVNNLDMKNKGRNKKGKHYITHCKNGHYLSEDNSYYRKNGIRQCLMCKRKQDRYNQYRRLLKNEK